VLRGQNKEVWPSAIRRAQEIRELAKRLGYLPNGSARAMRQGRFNCITLLLSANQGRSYLPDGLFNHIHDALHSQGMRLVVSKLADQKLTNEKLVPAILRELSCDGLLINYTDHIPKEMLKLIGRYQIPSIWINTRLPADCVHYDEFGGGMALTERLLRLGHRRIAYLDFVPLDGRDIIHYSRVDRYEGYAQAMRSAGLQPTAREQFAGVPQRDRLTATQAMLGSPDRPTALISYDAFDRMLYAAALAGLRVPEEVSLASFGPAPVLTDPTNVGETFIGLRPTLARVPAEKAGEQAVRMLLEKIADPEKKLPPCVVPLELDAGDTSGPAPV
jgi:LacI family transcriptional regulator